MMRKIIVVMALMFGIQMSQAQTVDGIIREFCSEEDAVCVKVPWLPIRLVGLFADDEAGLLPKDLKRGVLSEDGLWNLLTR